VRFAHVATHKGWMSAFTDKTGPLRRRVAKTWHVLSINDEGAGTVVAEFGEDFMYGSNQVFICFNIEDPMQLTQEYDPYIGITLKLTPLLPIRGEALQMMKVFDHFHAICKRGEGHLIHYHNLEARALQMLSFLRATEAIKDTIYYDARHDIEISERKTSFHTAVRFLSAFCDSQLQYRGLFTRNDVFHFLVKAVGVLPIGISQLLVSIFYKNEDAIDKISLKFVQELLDVLVENLTTAPVVSLDALKVMLAMVTCDQDSTSTRDNGNVIMLLFLRENTRLARENPMIPMAFEGFSTFASMMKEDNAAVMTYVQRAEDIKEKRSAMMRRENKKEYTKDKAKQSSESKKRRKKKKKKMKRGVTASSYGR